MEVHSVKSLYSLEDYVILHALVIVGARKFRLLVVRNSPISRVVAEPLFELMNIVTPKLPEKLIIVINVEV